MHSVPTGGRLTGKGAGSLKPTYSGVFVVDDSIKPIDANSVTKREEVNDRFVNTFLSRLANGGFYQNEDGDEIPCCRTPMIVICQRLHEGDIVGHILRGKTPDEYDWLNIPAVLSPGVGSKDWYDSIIMKQGYSHAKPVYYDLNVSEERALWPSRIGLEVLYKLKEADPYTFNSQYMNDPAAKGTGVIDDDWWIEYEPEELNKANIKHTFMVCDTASTTKTYSDYSVLGYFGVTNDNCLKMLDVEIGKWQTPVLMRKMHEFWEKHCKLDLSYPQMIPRAMYVEDKSSGHYIIQQIMASGGIRMLPIPRDKTQGDKLARFLNTVPYFTQGRVQFPKNHKHIGHMRREVTSYTSLGSGTGHDDVVDVISDACSIAFSVKTTTYGGWI